jgi:hypothetical protein
MRTAATASALALVAFLAFPLAAKASPQFQQMKVAISSLDRGKDAATQVEISIQPDAGGDAVAYLDIRDSAFAPNGTVQEVVPVAGAGFTLDELKSQYILVKASQSQPGSWHLTMDVILQFNDGSQALLGTGKLTLSSNNPQAIVPLSLATVAHPGVMGSMAKLGFGLLSKTSADRAPAASTSSAAPRSPKEFTHMDLAFQTGNRGLDASGRVEVSVVPRDGGPAVAYLDIQGRGFGPHSKLSVVVPPALDGFSIDDLKREQILVKVTTPGYGAWSCRYDAILHFADGSQAMIGSDSLDLSNGNDHDVVALAKAAVAHPGLMGGFEKLSFKIVSKGAVQPTTEQESDASPATVAAVAAPGAAAPQGPAHPTRRVASNGFTGMDIKLWSGNSGKDAQTGVEVSIVLDAGGPAVAHLAIADRAIGPGTSLTETVPATDAPFTLADLKKAQIVVKIAPSGHVRWQHGLDVILHFADGSAALWSTGELVLSNLKTEEAISLSGASLASNGVMGSMEKLSFGLLNHFGK